MDELDEAVKGLLAGDESAFQRIVDKTAKRLVRLAARMLGNVSDAEDVVQDAYVKAYRSLVNGDFDRRSKLETWLYRIVVNTAIDARRRRSRGPEPRDDIAGGAWDGASSAEAHVALGELRDWLADLPEEQQSAVILKSIEGLSANEVAEVLGTTEGAVEQLLVRARSALRKKRGDE